MLIKLTSASCTVLPPSSHYLMCSPITLITNIQPTTTFWQLLPGNRNVKRDEQREKTARKLTRVVANDFLME